jgi:hypothetical protein
MKEKKAATNHIKCGEVSLLCLLTLVLCSQPLQAQPQPYGQQQQQPPAGGKPPRETMRRILHSMPANVPVPMPPDAQFVTGYQTQYEWTKPTTFIRVSSANTATALIDWYRKSLSSYGWQVSAPAQAGKLATMIYATRQNMNCTIDVSNTTPMDKKGRSLIMIRYSEH